MLKCTGLARYRDDLRGRARANPKRSGKGGRPGPCSQTQTEGRDLLENQKDGGIIGKVRGGKRDEVFRPRKVRGDVTAGSRKQAGDEPAWPLACDLFPSQPLPRSTCQVLGPFVCLDQWLGIRMIAGLRATCLPLLVQVPM